MRRWFSQLGIEHKNISMQRTIRSETLRETMQVIFKLVGIPLLCMAPLFLALLYFLGGADLLRFALSQLTWKVAFKIVCGIAWLAFVTGGRHAMWYQDDPPPLWWRQSAWLNLLEVLILLAVILLGIWAIPRFGTASP
jgi:hypothetical protein